MILAEKIALCARVVAAARGDVESAGAQLEAGRLAGGTERELRGGRTRGKRRDDGCRRQQRARRDRR